MGISMRPTALLTPTPYRMGHTCSSESDSRYTCGSRSGLADNACPIFTNEGPNPDSRLRSSTARSAAFLSILPKA